jgi:endonuclease G
VGIGLKEIEGVATEVIQFTVDSSYSSEPEVVAVIPADQTIGAVIPDHFEFDGLVVPTDVVSRKFKPEYIIVPEPEKDYRKQRQQIISPGLSVSHPTVSAGTIGCIVYDQKSGRPYILSNWHVLQGPRGSIGDAILQPGMADDNNMTGNVIGKLVRSHLGVAGDCAIATIENRQFDPSVYGLDTVPSIVAKAELNDKVAKSGRTTAITYGIVRRVEVTAKIFYGDGVGYQNIGGFEIGPDPDKPSIDLEVSKGGDSGSLWLALNAETGKYEIPLGLHFAGETVSDPDEHALASNIHSVLEKLEVSFQPPQLLEAASIQNIRKGYQEGFLSSFVVKHPTLQGDAAKTELSIPGSENNLLHYAHFSLKLNRERRTAIYVASNIDGMHMVKISNDDTEWKLDERIEAKYQTGNEYYRNNAWDRGHLAHRESLIWGFSVEEARQANSDSFHFTNAALQHENFNQDEWVALENWVLDFAKKDNYRLCVFVGPVFRKDDIRLSDIKIPAAFWKVVVLEKQDGSITAVTFLMNQMEEQIMKDKNGRTYIRFQLYQISLQTLEELTGVVFEELKEVQPQEITEQEFAAMAEGAEPQPWPIVLGAGDIKL